MSSTETYPTDVSSTVMHTTEMLSTKLTTDIITSTQISSTERSPTLKDLYIAYMLIEENMQKLSVTVEELRQKFGSDIKTFFFPIR